MCLVWKTVCCVLHRLNRFLNLLLTNVLVANRAMSMALNGIAKQQFRNAFHKQTISQLHKCGCINFLSLKVASEWLLVTF